MQKERKTTFLLKSALFILSCMIILCFIPRNLKATTSVPTSLPSSTTALTNSYFQFELTDDDKVIITGYNNAAKPESLKVPDFINGFPVVEISYGVFTENKHLKSITLPESITKIQGSAFRNCKALESINIPKNIKKIESYTFADCKNLKEIIIPDKVTTISKQLCKIKKGSFG